jgi:VanZ family protein
MRIQLDRRYSLLAMAYLLTIYWLSSRPDLGTHESTPLAQLVMNLGHIPLFAGLAFCALKSLSQMGERWWARYALVFSTCAACGALDEWHQSFVPGRDASMGDFLLDLAGIGGMLLLLRLHSVWKERCEARDAVARGLPPPNGLAAGAWPVGHDPLRRGLSEL